MTPRKAEKIIEPLNSDVSFEDLAASLVSGQAKEEFVRRPKDYPRSPLRYPGGKSRAVKSIFSIIPEDETRLCSPFLGGGSIELACSPTMEVKGFDVFEPLTAFWQVLIKEPDTLANRVERYYPLSKAKFYSLQKRFVNLKSELERAAAFYVLNRASFSGTTLSGGMSPNHPRFTESSIQRLRDFHADNFEVGCGDFKDIIPQYKDYFLYLDPPYKNGQSLYGVKGNTHTDFEHEDLAELLLNREKWIMSYNDSDTIRKLYKKNTILSLEWAYGMSKNKNSSEILILSRDIG